MHQQYYKNCKIKNGFLRFLPVVGAGGFEPPTFSQDSIIFVAAQGRIQAHLLTYQPFLSRIKRPKNKKYGTETYNEEEKMKKWYAKDFKSFEIGTEVDFMGWIKSVRKHKIHVFLTLEDSTGAFNAVINSNSKDFKTAENLLPESSIHIQGSVEQHPKEVEEFELRINALEIIGKVEINLSPQPRADFNIFDENLIPHLLNKRHFYLRNQKIGGIIKFRHYLMQAVHTWFQSRDFIQFDAPILTPTALYNDNTPMGLSVHGQDVFLTQCVGFYLEQAVHAFERIYNMGPSFRAEESRSKRHLMEYWHIKAEVAFIDLEGLMKLVEDFISGVTEILESECSELVKSIGTEMCLDGKKTPYPRIKYADAIELLQKKGVKINGGKSLSSSEEAILSQEFGSTPFWVVGIPRSIEPFPYSVNPQDQTLTMTADLIASNNMGELLGIAEKIHTLEMLDERLEEKGKNGNEKYEWLRDLRKYGSVPHGGFGLGVERFIRWILNIPHVRDAIPFHRTFGRKIDP